MGIEIIAAVGLGLLGAIEGEEKKKAAGKEASAIEKEAAVEKDDALKAAEIQKEKGETFLAEQTLGFLGSGLKLKGSPLEVLEETKKNVEADFEGRVSRADKVSGLRQEQASQTRNSANNAPLFGLVRGAVSGFTGFST